MTITPGDLDDVRVRALLAHHVASARGATSPGSDHALDSEGLKTDDILFWTAWEGDCLVGVGALRPLSNDHGEIKSMHIDASFRRRGIGSAMLLHIIDAARARGMHKLSLETGSWDYFAPARELYKKHGFVECPPFGGYKADPNSVFMSRTF